MTPEGLSDHRSAVLLSILNRVVNDAIQQRLDRAGFTDIRASQDAVFEMLDPGGSRVTDMAERARMTKQAMGQQVTYLDHRGYVERRPDPVDGRAKLVVLTPKGEAAVNEAVAAVTDLETRWDDHLGQKRARAFRTALAELSRVFGAAHVR